MPRVAIVMHRVAIGAQHITDGPLHIQLSSRLVKPYDPQLFSTHQVSGIRFQITHQHTNQCCFPNPIRAD